MNICICIAESPCNFTSGNISKGNETLTQKDICTSVFIAALFTLVKTWKQTKCPTMNEWIKKLWYVLYTGILFSHKETRKFCHL